jgi:hypothetical protein
LRWREIGHSAEEFKALMRELFDEISLSPYTDFVKKTLAFVEILEQAAAWTAEDRVDFLSWLLRRIVRHLTAFDLRTFHHRGANYPDALLLDAVLKSYLQAIEARPELFFSSLDDTYSLKLQKRRRRRALRQSWLLRRWYEGLPIPEFPTSPGENRRVLPGDKTRIRDDQILQPEKRSKRLFDNDNLDGHARQEAADLLKQSLADLQHSEELHELGMAIFLDRPLGVSKNPGEPDQTPLLSYLAFSRFIAQTRLKFFAEIGLLTEKEHWQLTDSVESLNIRGISPASSGEQVRPGSVSISDALRVAPDFVILRTTKRSASQFMEYLGVKNLGLPGGLPLLIVREPSPSGNSDPVLAFYDYTLTKRSELIFDASQGFTCRAGVELPRAGLRKLRVWKENG